MAKSLEVVFESLRSYPEKVVRGTLLEMSSRIIKRSPVDTGRFRNNWNASFGAPNTSTNASTDPSGAQSTVEAAGLLAQFQMGQTFYLTNNLPYSLKLEYGSSNQAPGGMVRLTAAEFDAEIKKQAGKL